MFFNSSELGRKQIDKTHTFCSLICGFGSGECGQATNLTRRPWNERAIEWLYMLSTYSQLLKTAQVHKPRRHPRGNGGEKKAIGDLTSGWPLNVLPSLIVGQSENGSPFELKVLEDLPCPNIDWTTQIKVHRYKNECLEIRLKIKSRM